MSHHAFGRLLFVLTMASMAEAYCLGYRFRETCCHIVQTNHMARTVRDSLYSTRTVFSSLGMSVPNGEVERGGYRCMGAQQRPGNIKRVNVRPMGKVALGSNRTPLNSPVSRRILVDQHSPVAPYGMTAPLPCSSCHNAVEGFLQRSLRGSEDISALSQAYLAALGAVRDHCGGSVGVTGLYYAQLGEAFARAVVTRCGGAPSPPPAPTGVETDNIGGTSTPHAATKGVTDVRSPEYCTCDPDDNNSDSDIGGYTGSVAVSGAVDQYDNNSGVSYVASQRVGDKAGRADAQAGSAALTAPQKPVKGRRLVREGDRYVYR